MSNAGILYLLLFSVAVTAFATHHLDAKLCAGADAQHDVAQQDNTIAAENAAAKKTAVAEATSTGVSHDYEDKITAFNSEYSAAIAGMQPAPNPASNGVRTSPAASSGHNAASCPAGFSWRDKVHLVALAKQADEQTARLVACQAWAGKIASQYGGN